MALGGRLIADDRTDLQVRDGHLWASAPETLHGLIEARGIGILRAAAKPARIALVIDMDRIETDRLPPIRTATFLDVTLPCLHKVETAAWPAGVVQYLRCGRSAPE